MNARSTLQPCEFLAWRLRHQWTQEQVAAKLGVKPLTVSQWETGRRVIRPATRVTMELLDKELK